jgi:hypothetical protein
VFIRHPTANTHILANVEMNHRTLEVPSVSLNVNVIIRYVLAFSIIVFLQGFFIYSPPPVHVYIQTFSPQINISVIHNMVYRGRN